MPRIAHLMLAVLFAATGSSAAYAQKPNAAPQKPTEKTGENPKEKPGEKASEKPGEKPKDEKKPPEEKIVQTKHSIRIGGQEIKYTATAGTILLKLEDDTPKASVFYIAYTKDDAGDLSKRPVTFTFNGGPGSASIWLHLGAFGPRRVEMGDAGSLLGPPYKLVDNEYSLLDVTDLVFIDPVSTGFSRVVPGDSRNNSMASKRMCSRWAISSACTRRATSVGLRQNFWRAKAMARRARLDCPVICRTAMGCI